MSLAEISVPLLEVNYQRKCNPGSLEVIHNNQSVSLPLSNVDISASVVNQIAEVTHKQTFQNPFNEHLEATYIFPLSGGAVVSHFEMIIGDKVILGKVKERQIAREEYNKAVKEGKKAALMEQERDDVFTVQVGNIPPSDNIQVKIVYSEKLAFFADGSTEIRLPLVVAPRYNPGELTDGNNNGKGIEQDTNIVNDASRISPPRLAPGFDAKVNLSINVEILQNESQTISELSCSQHVTKTSFGKNNLKISLSNTNELLNRDFILRWQMTQEKLENDLVFYKDNEGKTYGMLTVIPPKREGFFGLARDIVFVVDRSGSMEGLKMISAIKACSILLDTLGPDDRFSILAFDDSMDWFKPFNKDNKEKFINADEAGIEKGNKFLREINARGGTELDTAIGEAIQVIKKRKEKAEKMPLILLLTDGQIGDESRVLKRIQKELNDSRIFTVGIDTAVNESFLKRLAVLGGGTSTFVVPGEQLETALQVIGREIGNPLLVDINIQDENSNIIDNSISPAKIPDLFAGRTVNIFFKAKNPDSITVTGKFFQGGDFSTSVKGQQVNVSAISQLWAKSKIFSLEDDYRVSEANSYGEVVKDKNKIKEEIISLSVKHSILTKFTAFIAVDENNISNKDGDLRSVVQPVEEPANWEMQRAGGLSLAQPSVAAPMPTNSFGRSRSLASPMPPPGAAPMMKKSSAYSPPPEMDYMSEAEESFDDGFSVGGGSFIAQDKNKSGIISKISNLSKKIMSAKPKMNRKMAEVSDMSVMEEAKTKVVKVIDKNLVAAINNLLTSFENILSKLRAGEIPETNDFTKSRSELLLLMADSDMALDLIYLQRFLRNQSLEIIATLNSKNINPANVYSNFEKYNSDIKNIKDEIDSDNPSQDNNFWADNI